MIPTEVIMEGIKLITSSEKMEYPARISNIFNAIKIKCKKNNNMANAKLKINLFLGIM